MVGEATAMEHPRFDAKTMVAWPENLFCRRRKAADNIKLNLTQIINSCCCLPLSSIATSLC
jgi:hypothetical protein